VINIDLSQQLALLTGGTGSIGQAILELLVEAGAEVHFTYCQNELLARELAEKFGGRAIPHHLNFLDDRSTSEFLSAISEMRFSILINNVGIKNDKPFFYMKEKELRDILKVNLEGPFWLTKKVARSMVKERYGRIVNIGSIASFYGSIGQSNYASSKGGLIGFTRALAKELGGYNITVNAVVPGIVESQMSADIPQKLAEQYLSQIPTKRFGKPEEIAWGVLFLVSPQASYINGIALHINGGGVTF
jgi:3-oxoacyl-[acyl-carrier protein] reductase